MAKYLGDNSAQRLVNNVKTLVATKQDVLTTEQSSAVNSGITSALVAQINTNTSDIQALSGSIGAVIKVNSLDDVPAPTASNLNTLYLYNGTLYKWVVDYIEYRHNTSSGTDASGYIYTHSTQKSALSESGQVQTISTSFSNYSNFYVTDFLPVIPNCPCNNYRRYKNSSTTRGSTTYSTRICYYDENQTFISYITVEDNTGSGASSSQAEDVALTDIPSNAKYVRFGYYYNNNSNKLEYFQPAVDTAYYGKDEADTLLADKPSLSTVTSLFSGEIGTGSQNLSSAYTNYKLIVIRVKWTNVGVSDFRMMTPYNITNQANASDARVITDTDNEYCSIYFPSTTTFYLQDKSSNVFVQIFGVK